MIIYTDSKTIKQLSTTKNIEPTAGFIKTTTFVTFMKNL